jgi:hypothetical protein
MSRARRRRRSGGGETWKVVLGALAGLVAAGVLGAMIWLNATIERPPQLDAATLCPTGPDSRPNQPTDGARSVVVVLLDGSDALPEIAQLEVSKALTTLAESVPAGGLLDVRRLDPAHPRGEVLFQRCNPGDGAGLSEWTANPAAARRRWLADFREPVDAILARGVPVSDAETSPIMATIQGIAVEYQGAGDDTGEPNRLVIVSDMLENTPDYNQYREPLDYQAFKSSAAGRKFATNLDGAEVTIYYVSRDRSGEADSGAHIRFWEAWIADNGGRLVEAVKLQGIG